MEKQNRPAKVWAIVRTAAFIVVVIAALWAELNGAHR